MTSSSRRGHAALGQEGVGDDLLEDLLLAQVLLAPLGVGPSRVVRPVRLVGRVGIEDVEVDEDRHVAVVVEPLDQAVHVLARRLGARGPGAPRRRLRLVQLLEALVEVGELRR